MAFKINTITGLGYLSGLTSLGLEVNNLTTIDVSQNTVLQLLGLSDNLFTDAGVNNLVLPDSLQILYLNRNQIVNFDPTLPLPSGLENLQLGSNQIVTFNPTLPLPSGLVLLYLSNNQMTTAGYTASEPWANAMSIIPGRGSVYFSGNVNSITGTNLETILTAKGWTVTG